jgi:hypothetical protein
VKEPTAWFKGTAIDSEHCRGARQYQDGKIKAPCPTQLGNCGTRASQKRNGAGESSGGAGDGKRKRANKWAPLSPPKKKQNVSSEKPRVDDDGRVDFVGVRGAFVSTEEEADGRVDFVGVMQGEVAAYKVASPHPNITLEDGSKLKLIRNDRDELRRQGGMVTGITTTVYLSLLSRKCFH